MNHDLLNKYHMELRVNAQTTGFRREETAHVVRHISEYDDRGFILASALTDHNARSVIQAEKEYFKQIGQSFEWKLFSYDTPSNLKELLIAEGFEEDEEEALLVLDLNKDKSLLNRQIPVELKEMTDENGVKDIVHLMDEIWQDKHGSLGKRLWQDKQNQPDELFLYGVYDGSQLVSGAWMYLEKGSSFASLWGGATQPDYRGRGYYKDLVAARAKKAHAHGYSFLTVDARPMSRPILERLDFQLLAYTYGMLSPK
ncbi:GNAT family N-acetyltransferase [Halobacillus litoralis]|uniref:GNAT family N-acetyltransferase n=1 Tax=Halobacillus litoralis TaxID=45668 RepID=A0A845E6Q8_9BACI|nr:GNAT family N-acetyltransferase [Halobacillus litoralis]MYL51375.1 GNAT family N-acetyltransferase [Halobacillus litoralis]